MKTKHSVVSAISRPEMMSRLQLFCVGALVGATASYFLTSVVIVVGLLALFSGILSVVLRSVNRVLIISTIAIIASSWVTRLMLTTLGIVEVSVRVYVGMTLLLLGFALLVTTRSGLRRSWVDSAEAGLVTLLILVIWLVLTVTSRANPVYYIYLFNEDNGSVLDTTARFLQDSAITPSLFLDSGWLTTVVQSLAAIVSTIGRDFPSLGIEVMSSVTRVYALIGALTSVVAGLVVAGASSQRGHSSPMKFAWAVIGVLVGIPWILGTIHHGHLSALVAMACLLALLALSQVVSASLTFANRQILATSQLMLALAMGGAWHPFQPLSLVLVTGLLLVISYDVVREQIAISWWRSAAVTLCSVLIVASLARYALNLPYLKAPSEVLRQFQLAGAVAAVGQPLQWLVLVGMLWVGVQAKSQRFRTLFNVLLLYLAIIYSVSYFQGSTPMYGAFKTLLIVFGAVSPLILSEIVRQIKSPNAGRDRQLFLAALFGSVSLFVFSTDPFTSLAFVASNSATESNLRESRHKGLEIALQDSERFTICLSTDPDYTDYEMYKCSRLALGSQGIVRGPLSALMWGNLCQVRSADLYSISPATLENLRIVLSNPQRLSSGEGCGRRYWAGEGLDEDSEFLLGWTTAIPWGKVELVDLDGNKVEPSFAYLRESGEYDESEISKLEASLQKD